MNNNKFFIFFAKIITYFKLNILDKRQISRYIKKIIISQQFHIKKKNLEILI